MTIAADHFDMTAAPMAASTGVISVIVWNSPRNSGLAGLSATG